MLYRARGNLIVNVDNSKDLKLVVRCEKRFQGHGDKCCAATIAIEEVNESGTRQVVLMKVNPQGIASNS